MNTSIYDFKVKKWDGSYIPLSDYKGKVLMIVNTASACGFTPQYKGLQALYEKYKEKGFEILAFPCDQFAHQEKGSNQEIHEFCTINFRITFPIFEKIEVNGKNADPLYKYITSKKRGIFGTRKIKWNFTKFLIDRNGTITRRYAPATEPEQMENQIKGLL